MTALALDLEGYRDYESTSWDKKKPTLKLFTGGQVERVRITEYFTEYYFSAMEIYNRFKRFGFPFIGGWAEQPGYIVRLIELFDVTVTEWQRIETERERKKHGNS